MAFNPLITLMTDFGTCNAYVGAMKGAIYSIHPEARIVDIAHDIPAHNVQEAAFTLLGYYNTFPERTLHIVVVDPEVGSARKPLYISTENYQFMVPDNGVMSYVLEREEIERIIALDQEHYYRMPVSPTFHARDIFAPCAAWLAKGTADSNSMGETLDKCQRWDITKPKMLGGKLIKGKVIHVDRFGNVITNITQSMVDKIRKAQGSAPKVILGSKEITEEVTHYAEGKSEVFFLYGCTGFLEVAANKKSACQLLGLEVGKDVGVSF